MGRDYFSPKDFSLVAKATGAPNVRFDFAVEPTRPHVPAAQCKRASSILGTGSRGATTYEASHDQPFRRADAVDGLGVALVPERLVGLAGDAPQKASNFQPNSSFTFNAWTDYEQQAARFLSWSRFHMGCTARINRRMDQNNERP
jgi:hypothetical protein